MRSSTCTRFPRWLKALGPKYTQEINDPTFNTGTVEKDKVLLKNLIAYYCVLEGIFFYCGHTDFTDGSSQQNDRHLGAVPVHSARRVHAREFRYRCHQPDQPENPQLWQADMQEWARAMIPEGTELEVAYARDTMPWGVLGMNANMMEEYLQFIANADWHNGLAEQFLEPRTRFRGCLKLWTWKKKRTLKPALPIIKPAAL